MKKKNTTTSNGNTTPHIVQTQVALTELADRLREAQRIGVDTESNSMYAYREQVCLIQISIPGTDYLVDPLALDDLSALAPIFAAPEIEKIFHAADYDLMVLRRDFKFHCKNLFDTMWAARVLGWSGIGLGSILERHFGVEVNKRYQRYNWGQRPLDPKALRYAWRDSHYLLALRDIQAAELKERGRWEEAQEIFAYLCENVTLPHSKNKMLYFWRIKGVNKLSKSEKALLYRLYCWRERKAKQLDYPPARFINNKRLLQLTRIQPRTLQELRSAGLSRRQAQRFGEEILEALRSNPKRYPRRPTPKPRQPHEVMERYYALKAWRKEVAARRGVDSDVILPNAVLQEIAQNPPHTLDDLLEISGIGPWRQQAYGPAILKLMDEN
jgi:ribonuclease D